jgi:hypothetical protein
MICKTEIKFYEKLIKISFYVLQQVSQPDYYLSKVEKCFIKWYILRCVDFIYVLSRPLSCGPYSQIFIKMRVFHFDKIKGRY